MHRLREDFLGTAGDDVPGGDLFVVYAMM